VVVGRAVVDLVAGVLLVEILRSLSRVEISITVVYGLGHQAASDQ
jgi:hypothetical protein